MIADNQTSAIAFLMEAGSPGEPVEMIETHISRIFLAGTRAYKMKRAVSLPYADFSTPALRLAFCEKEVELNTKTAPGLYLGVRRITREADGAILFDGHGELVDAVVEMVRFDQKCLFDKMAAAGELTAELMTELARTIVQFHRTAPVIHSGGGAANISAVLDINEAGFAESHVFDAAEVAAFSAAFRSRLMRHADRLDRRETAGKVRRSHGDLHLRNICLLDGVPRLFDCIDFNDQIATVDTLYDLAFLLMDLWHSGHRDFANLVMNRYLDESDDEDGFVLLPFFMAVRAAVRAHVTATQAKQSGDRRDKLVADARTYFDLALSLLDVTPARLIAIGGLSGSGKSTVAEMLASQIGAPPGARIIESDRVRKAMHGVSAETRLPDKAYRPEVSETVYRQMAWRADLVLAEGGCVVADATFDKKKNRGLMEEVATRLDVPFAGIWLEAEPALLWRRVGERQDGPSDATVDILSRQLDRRTEQIDWHRIDASPAPQEVADEILRASTGPGAMQARRRHAVG
jgi:aminoglycoside phosphotransferase family enzyme/predicted kinase